MSQQLMEHRSVLVSKLDVNSAMVQQRVAGLQQGFMAKGDASNNALQKAYAVMDYSVTKQAMVLSYMDVFLYIGLIFLVCVPFVLMIKNKKQAEKLDLSAAH